MDQNNPRNKHFAAAYLTECFEDGKEVFLVALRDVVRARGGFKKLSEALDRARPGLYRGLDEDGNPSFDTVMEILRYLELNVRFAA